MQSVSFPPPFIVRLAVYFLFLSTLVPKLNFYPPGRYFFWPQARREVLKIEHCCKGMLADSES